MDGPARHAPATARNAGPILALLTTILPPAGLVLEVASGTGEHALRFAAAFPRLDWQSSDPDPGARASIAAWREAAALPNLRPPVALDAAAPDWPIVRADAVLCINMVHISPWSATEGLMRGAAALLPLGAPSTSTARSGMAMRRSPRATPRSMPICAGAILHGACATRRA